MQVMNLYWIYTYEAGQDIKYKNDKYMLFVMNMVVICHVHHLSTDMEGETYKWSLKVHLEILAMFLLQYNYRVSKITVWLNQIFSTGAKVPV